MEEIYVEIYGTVDKKTYSFGCYSSFSREEAYETRCHYKYIKDALIWKGTIKGSKYLDGEYVHIDELGTSVKIKNTTRLQNGGYRYLSNYTVKTIEDDETKSSYIKALEKEVEYYKNKLKDAEKEMQHVVSVPETSIEKKWYQFWK